MSALVPATRNDQKLRELREALPGIEIDPLPDDVELPPETDETFAQNALVKARTAQSATGRAARDAGENAGDEENLAKLLREVGEQDDRRIAYVSVIALVTEEGEESLFKGRCEGTLASEPRGRGGFGYDRAFIRAGHAADDGRS